MRLHAFQRHVSVSTRGAMGGGGGNNSARFVMPPMKNLGPTTTTTTTRSSSSSSRTGGKFHGCGKRTLSTSTSSSLFQQTNAMAMTTATTISRVRKTIHTTSRRSYKVITSTSNTSSSSNNGDSNPSNTKDALASAEEMDQLLAKALIEAKQISALAMQRKINHTKKSHRKAGKGSVDLVDGTIKGPTAANFSSSNVVSDTSSPSVQSISDEKLSSSSSRLSNNSIIQKEVIEAEIRMEIQDEINAAEALLRLTDNPSFRMALSLERSRKTEDKSILENVNEDGDGGNDTRVQNVASSLHSAFILVVNWLCSTLASCPVSDVNQDQNFVTFPSHLPPGDTSIVPNFLPPSPPATKESMLLTHISDLLERSRILNLPLTIPQYQTIASMIGRHSSAFDVPIQILEISTVVSEVYGIDKEDIDADDKKDMGGKQQEQVVRSHFFDGALKELLKRNRMRDMIEIFEGMKAIHDIDDIDPKIGIELLTILKEKIDDSVAGVRSVDFDEVDATELTIILQKPVMKALDSRRRELVQYQQILGETMDSLFGKHDLGDGGNDDDSDDLDKDDTMEANAEYQPQSDVETDDIHQSSRNNEDAEGSNAILDNVQILENLVNIWNSPDSSEEERKTAKDEATRILNKIREERKDSETSSVVENKADNETTHSERKPMGITARVQVDNETGEVEGVNLFLSSGPTSAEQKGYDHMRNEMLKFMIYCRDNSYEIPDVVSQLEAWNNGISLQFTEEYEKEMAKEVSEENGGFFDTDKYNPDDNK